MWTSFGPVWPLSSACYWPWVCTCHGEKVEECGSWKSPTWQPACHLDFAPCVVCTEDKQAHSWLTVTCRQWESVMTRWWGSALQIQNQKSHDAKQSMLEVGDGGTTCWNMATAWMFLRRFTIFLWGKKNHTVTDSIPVHTVSTLFFLSLFSANNNTQTRTTVKTRSDKVKSSSTAYVVAVLPEWEISFL